MLLRVLCMCILIMLIISSLIGVLESSPKFYESQIATKSVLVFGGNGFIGSYTVENLLRENYTVVIVNRGNWYWDSATRVKPFVKHLKCDRMQSLQRCAGLQHYLWSVDAPAYFDAVVDFSAYHAFEISEALSLLRGKINKYIYISSDSIYDVCNKTHSDPSREEDAVRPESADERERLKHVEYYGHRKLECEEELQNQYDKNGDVPYISLRLPDVVGPRDNTYRWWLYQLWVKLSNHLGKPVTVPRAFWNEPMSLVYANDVADVITDLIKTGTDVKNEAFNLALNETPTLVQFLYSLMDTLNIEDTVIEADDTEHAFRLFPSATSGSVDTTKAKRVLGWNPASWINVLDTTTQFYEDAIQDGMFDQQRRDVITTLQQHFSNDPMKVMQALHSVYDITFNSKDEL